MDSEATSVAQSTNPAGVTSLTITGTGFTNIKDTVTGIGDGNNLCEPTTIEATQIICTLPEIIVGTYDLKIYLNSKAEVKLPRSPSKVTVGLAVSQVSPLTVGIGGGTTLQLTGRGFPTSTAQVKKDTVVINERSCKVKTTSYSSITCLTPANTTAGSYPVVVMVNGKIASSQQLTYRDLTTNVTALSQTSTSVLGGHILTITGTLFSLN